jgi:hypothetical protein
MAQRCYSVYPSERKKRSTKSTLSVASTYFDASTCRPNALNVSRLGGGCRVNVAESSKLREQPRNHSRPETNTPAILWIGVPPLFIYKIRKQITQRSLKLAERLANADSGVR